MTLLFPSPVGQKADRRDSKVQLKRETARYSSKERQQGTAHRRDSKVQLIGETARYSS